MEQRLAVVKKTPLCTRGVDQFRGRSSGHRKKRADLNWTAHLSLRERGCGAAPRQRESKAHVVYKQHRTERAAVGFFLEHRLHCSATGVVALPIKIVLVGPVAVVQLVALFARDEEVGLKGGQSRRPASTPSIPHRATVRRDRLRSRFPRRVCHRDAAAQKTGLVFACVVWNASRTRFVRVCT